MKKQSEGRRQIQKRERIIQKGKIPINSSKTSAEGWCRRTWLTLRKIAKELIPVCTVIIGFCTIVALFVAVRSLDEAVKTRKDMFLPILIVPHQQEGSSFRLQNCGHGMALEVEARIGDIVLSLYGVTSFEVGEELQYVYGREIHEFFEERSESQLLITYRDIFHRKIRTIYPIQKKDGRYTTIDMENYKIDLP